MNEDYLDKDGEKIDNWRAFLRDIENGSPSKEIKAISFADSKNKWIYFGLWALHPTKNLIAEISTSAANSYGYGGFTRLSQESTSFERMDRDHLARVELGNLSIKHGDIVEMARNFRPRPDCWEPVTEIGNSFDFKRLISRCDKRHFYDSNIIPQDWEGRIVDPVCVITDEQRSEFLESWDSLPENLVTIEKSNHKLSTVYTPAYYKRLIKKDQERELVQERRKKESKKILEEWEPAPITKSLYLMKDEACGAYKIGVSNNPKHREKTLAAEKPTIKIVGTWEGIGDQEKLWHKHFRRERMRGEWFNLSSQQVRFFVHRCVNGKGAPK